MRIVLFPAWRYCRLSHFRAQARPSEFSSRKLPIKKKITIANENENVMTKDGDLPADLVQPFMLDVSQLRGRIVRLPNLLEEIIAAHDYPEPVEKLLAEALCLTTLLAGMLKFNGAFTLQVKGEGPLRMLVCDMTNDGVLRGMASFDPEAVAALGEDADFLTLTLRGYLAFTVDQADSDERTQGITELVGASLTAAIQHYFKQSEQIRTAFVTQIDKDKNDRWQGAAMMLQQIGLEGGIDSIHVDDVEENWRRSMMLMGTIQPYELLDPATSPNGILYKIFHEEMPRVFDPIPLSRACRCSIDRIAAVIESLPQEERVEIAENGVISVTCEFCNTTYAFPVDTGSDASPKE